MYTPLLDGQSNSAYLVVRTSGDPLALTTSVQHAIAGLDPELAGSNPLTMAQLVSNSIAGQQFNLILVAAFAGLALFIAAFCLYGVISYISAQRTSEFGIRIALGAEPRSLVSLVLRQSLTPSLAGMAAGGAAAFLIVRVMRSMLFETSPFDPGVFAGVAALLLVTSLLASLVPALRASGIDPARTLRSS
jgi:ABC-type antimicrobial peptide transport system permease subunit